MEISGILTEKTAELIAKQVLAVRKRKNGEYLSSVRTGDNYNSREINGDLRE